MGGKKIEIFALWWLFLIRARAASPHHDLDFCFQHQKGGCDRFSLATYRFNCLKKIIEKTPVPLLRLLIHRSSSGRRRAYLPSEMMMFDCSGSRLFQSSVDYDDDVPYPSYQTLCI
jgi:hypothetical protein